jgi:transcriptional regulator NrdR family protein
MSQPLEKVEGPECPDCGCPDSDVIREGTRWGQTVQRRQCAACGTEFTAMTRKPKPAASKRKQATPEEQIVEALRRLRSPAPEQ